MKTNNKNNTPLLSFASFHPFETAWLYRAEYSTFEDYCRERWGWERRHAYRLMDAAKAVENVSNWTQIPPTNGFYKNTKPNPAAAHDYYSYAPRKERMLMKVDENKDHLKDNQNAVKHGGEGAIRRISEGKPLIGLASQEEKTVTDDLLNVGIGELVKHDAIRLQTALNLYWNAVTKAAQDGNIPDFDRYIARFGWLAGVTLRAWDQVCRNEKEAAKNGVGIVDVLRAISGGNHEPED